MLACIVRPPLYRTIREHFFHVPIIWFVELFDLSVFDVSKGMVRPTERTHKFVVWAGSIIILRTKLSLKNIINVSKF